MATVSDNRIVMTVEDVRTTLADRLKAAKQYDTERRRDHATAEAEWLKGFRAACRDATKLSYKAAVKVNGRYESVFTTSPPDCPTLAAPHIEQWIARLEHDTRDIVHVEPNSPLDRALTWRPGGWNTDTC